MKYLLLFILFCTQAFGQNAQRELNIDLLAFCSEHHFEALSDEIDIKREQACKMIHDLKDKNVPPVLLTKKDSDGQAWTLRFHFGFTRTDYHPTDLDIKSSVINVQIKDVEMHERTSANHYDPRTWTELQNAGQWIDEPTNTFTFSMEKKKNKFYLTVFHPKYLKSLTYTKTQENDSPNYEFSEIAESDNFSSPIPEKSEFLYLGNTHYNMIWQAGYGREFVVFDSTKAGKLSYTVKGDIGINTGKARSVHIVPGVAWDDYYDQHKIQGLNTSLGHRLEYQRGKVSLFVDQKYLYAKVHHGFYDGTIDYDLKATATTFGIGIDLFTKNKKR